MKKPIISILLGGLIVGLLGAGLYLYFSKSTPLPDIAQANPTPTLIPKLLRWEDPAGFSIEYPEGLELNKHDEDKVNYARLEFTSKAHSGGLVVWVKDLPKGINDTNAWGKRTATPSSAISFDTTLGDKPAQKILISRPQKMVTVGVVYDGVLWYIEANLDDEPYWQFVYDILVGSFAFAPLSTAVPGGAAPDIAIDEEEILE